MIKGIKELQQELLSMGIDTRLVKDEDEEYSYFLAYKDIELYKNKEQRREIRQLINGKQLSCPLSFVLLPQPFRSEGLVDKNDLSKLTTGESFSVKDFIDNLKPVNIDEIMVELVDQNNPTYVDYDNSLGINEFDLIYDNNLAA